MAEWSLSASDLQSSGSTGSGLEYRSDHYLYLFHSSPVFKSSTTLVNSQLVCLLPVGFLNNVMFNLSYLLQLFAWPHKHLFYKHHRG